MDVPLWLMYLEGDTGREDTVDFWSFVCCACPVVLPDCHYRQPLSPTILSDKFSLGWPD